MAKCKTCDGYGEYEITNFVDEPQLTSIEACPSCHGTGEIEQVCCDCGEDIDHCLCGKI